MKELNEIRNLKLRIEELRSRAEGTASKPLTGMPGGGRGKDDTLEDIVLLTEKLEKEWGIIEQKMEPLKPSEKKVVEQRYYEGKSWKQVADSMGVKKPTIRTYHSRAMQSLKNA